MKRAIAPLLTLALIVVVAFALWQGQRSERAIGVALAERDSARAANRRAAARVTAAMLHYRRDTIRLTKAVTRYDTALVRDTLVRNDTVFVPRAAADAAVNACLTVKVSCEEVQAALRDSAKTVRDELDAERKLTRRPWTSVGVAYDPVRGLGGYLERDWSRLRGGVSVTPGRLELRVGVRW